MYVQFSMFISLLVSYTVLCKKIRFFTKYLQRNSAFSSIPKCTNLRKYVVDSHDATTP